MRALLFLFLFFTLAHPLYCENWNLYKKNALVKTNKIPGWCSAEKAEFLIELVKKHRFLTSIEIGTFAGKSLFPIAKALKYNKKGVVYALDAWDPSYVLQELNPNHADYIWWSKIDFNNIHQQVVDLLHIHQLKNYCKIIQKPADEALASFKKESVDFIHLDCSRKENIALEQTVAAFQKLKNDGYFLLTDPNWYSMKSALVFLLERSEIASPFNSKADFILFRKSKERISRANAL